MDTAVSLRSFAGPWTRKGAQLLLACGKCQRKLRKDGDPDGLGKLKKLLKKRARVGHRDLKFHMIETKCLKVCPKRGVAVCTQGQMGAGRGSVLRSVEDVDLLVQICQSDALAIR